eukprot:scaffold1605_cov141-Cylindrotheca_fusiformis.AAC.16
MSLVQQQADHGQSRPQLPGAPRKDRSLFTKFVLRRSGLKAPMESTSFDSSTTTMTSASSSLSASINFHLPRRMVTSPSSSNLMQWLQSDCPHDLLPKILAFSGPQLIATISRTNRFWHELVSQEATWRTLCTEMYKWREGDESPISWRTYYMRNPCVPVDFSTIPKALSCAQSPGLHQCNSVRVLLRPGRYILREPISVLAGGGAEITVETMEMPSSFHPVVEAPNDSEPKKRRKSLRQILSCRSVDEDDEDEEDPLPDFLEPATKPWSAPNRKQATLTLRSRRQNEPIVRVRQGSCTLRNLELRHISYGTDIWNGNAAVQIQPPMGLNDQPVMVVPSPSAILENVDITSASGRGIVNIDGGNLTIRRCYIHDCAATGIYIGSAMSKVVIDSSDVTQNGNGNVHHRRGIGRGHSGIYLEQGLAHITSSNISQNSLTGISAVNPSNAILHLIDSDLVSNGAFQLEMPEIGSVAERQSITRNVNISASGFYRPRSGLMMPPSER